MNNLNNLIVSLLIDEIYNRLPDHRDTEVSNMIVPTQQDFDNIQQRTEEELIDMGFMNAYAIVDKIKIADESDKPLEKVWLFPVEWYEHIPEGYIVTDLLQKTEKFQKETHESDSKFGCLAYGFVKE